MSMLEEKAQAMGANGIIDVECKPPGTVWAASGAIIDENGVTNCQGRECRAIAVRVLK
jgi:hypothetical protein